MAAKSKIFNLRQVKRNFEGLGPRGDRAFDGAVYLEGLRIISKAVPEAPSITGRLRNSNYATHPDAAHNVEIGFATVYAESVEEGLITLLEDMAPRQRAAAFLAFEESGFRTSDVGGPFFLRNAIRESKGGRAKRVHKFAARLFAQNRGLTPDPSTPSSESAGKAKGETFT